MTAGYSFLRTMLQTRSKGHTATGVVCYRFALAAASTFPGNDGRAREFDYSRRTGVAATGYAAPAGAHDSWRDPITWAHRIEAVDRRKNSRQCRDDVIGIPIELVDSGFAVPAIQAYAQQLADLHGTVVHWSIHLPDRGGKNTHAHVVYAGRRVEGRNFSKNRDRTQDNPANRGDPDLVTQHKTIWSDVCRGYGIELTWSSEMPGHHIGPKVCAIKRGRLVDDARDAIRETVVASETGERVVDQRVLEDVATIATGVNTGLTVREMLEVELQHAQHGRPAPRAVARPAACAPQVLQPVVKMPQVMLPLRVAPVVPPPVSRAPEVVPPVAELPEILPPVILCPAVVPPERETPQVPLPVRRAPEVVPPVAELPEILPPVILCPAVAPPERETPQVSLPVRRAPEVVPPVAELPEILPPVILCPAVVPPERETPQVPLPVRRAPEVVPPVAELPEILPPVILCPAVVPPERETPQVSLPVRRAPEVVPPVAELPEILPPVILCPAVVPPERETPQVLPPARKPHEVPPPRFSVAKREDEDPVEVVVRVTKREYPTETSSTWLAARAQLRERYDTPADKIVQVAWTAAGELSALASTREKRSIPPPPATDASRLNELVEWLFELARLVLKQLGLMNPKPAPAGPVARRERDLQSLAQQLEVHVLPHDGEQLAVSKWGFIDLKEMLDNDDEFDTEAKALLERVEAGHAEDEEERERAERRLHWREINLALSAAERKRRQEAASKWFGRRAAAELNTDERKGIARDVIRREAGLRLRDRVRSFCRERRVVQPPPARPAPASQLSNERRKERGYDYWTG